MYEKIKTMVAKYPRHYYIIGALIVLLCVCAGYILYQPSGADYHRAVDAVERAQGALEDSRRLNRELNKLIETSRQLNNDAGDRIKRIDGYQQRESESLNRIEGNQRETGARISESLEQNNRARAELNSSLELIRRIEERNQEQ